MRIFKFIGQNTSILGIAVVIFVTFYTVLHQQHWKEKHRVISWDIISYYAYLPATFIYDDISLDFVDDPADTSTAYLFWPSKTEDGENVIKTSMGLSYCYAPFFFLAHGYALMTDFEATGFTEPYKFMLIMSSVFFMIIGLFYFRKILKLYFNEHAVALTLMLVVLSTNLHFYTAYEGPMAHAYVFALTAAFIWYSIRWYRNQTWKDSIILGLIAGLISLIRPTDIVVGFIFIFWGVSNWKLLVKRFQLLIRKWPMILVLLLIAFAIWIPQLLYWKMQTGHYLFFSYGPSNERFFFDQPQFMNGFFSWRKGLFIYTPIMLLAVIGMFFVRKHNAFFRWFIPVFFFLNAHIIFSWWCWWYGGCHGARPFIDFFAILFIPIAALLHEIFVQRRLWAKLTMTVLMFLFMYVGLFQSWQYYKGLIHWDSMTKEAYFINFMSDHTRPGYWEALKQPEYEKARLGEEDYYLN